MSDGVDRLGGGGGGGGVGYRVPRSRFGARHKAGRLVWGVVQGTVFRWSPRPLFWWRRWLLSLFGARLSAKARVYPRARVWAPWNLEMGDFATIADDVDVYCVDRISLGERAIVSQYSYLCGATHDFEDERRPLVPKPIVIGRRCWVAADVFVGPGVTLGEGCVVGARSSVFTDLPGWSVCVGSPARVVRGYGVGGETEPRSHEATKPRSDGATERRSDAAGGGGQGGVGS